MNFDVQIWPIDRLIPYANNPRINDDAVDQVAAMIHEFGFRVPMLVKSDGSLIDGHLRLKAARKLGLTDVPVHLVDNLSDAQIKALRIAINKAAELASWDNEKLAIEFEELQNTDIDLEVTGFNLAQIDNLTRQIDKNVSEVMESSFDDSRGNSASNCEGGAKELNPDDFSEDKFANECPKCGFKFN